MNWTTNLFVVLNVVYGAWNTSWQMTTNHINTFRGEFPSFSGNSCTNQFTHIFHMQISDNIIHNISNKQLAMEKKQKGKNKLECLSHSVRLTWQSLSYFVWEKSRMLFLLSFLYRNHYILGHHRSTFAHMMLSIEGE